MEALSNFQETNMESKILESAEKLFLDKGFSRTSTTEIARIAGCNHAMVHYYFRTKEKLFLKIFEQKILMFAKAFFNVDNSNDSFEEKLRKKIGAHFDILVKNPKIPMFILNELATSPERVSLVKNTFGQIPFTIFKNLETELNQEIKKGNIRPTTPQDLIMNILSLNIFLFASLPIFKEIMNIPEEEIDLYIAHRKEEIIETILRSLRP